MNFLNTITVGFKEIWAHKFRSLLTMLGIILGVSSLVAMSAMVKGMEMGMKFALAAAGGLEKIVIESEEDLPEYQSHLQDQLVGVTLNDVYALKNAVPLAELVTPFVEVQGYRERTSVSYRGKRARPYIFSGTWPGALDIMEHVIDHGRMFNEIDDENARSVCVIGTGIRDQLFGDPEIIGQEIVPIGETININNQPMTIVGMFQHYEDEGARKERLARMAALREQSLTNATPQNADRRRRAKGGDWIFRMKNNTIYIPLNTMLLKFRSGAGTGNSPDPKLSSLNMKISDVEELTAALQQARNVLMLTHNGLEDFQFRTQEDMAEEITTSIRDARISGTIISAISLIVGGIGIMNIMLASISERVREIGIRKAVGATTAAVFAQILLEAVVIAVVGGIAGLGASVGLVQGLAAATPSTNSPIITAGAMLFAVTCSATVGIVAGLIPAIKASRLHPIQALRYD